MSRRDGSYACLVDEKAESVKKEVKVKILTVSDGVAHGVRENKSSEALVERVSNEGWIVADTSVTPDGDDEVAKTLVSLAQDFHGLIVTTGGTGFGPRDQTPEGTLKAIEREAPGLAEAMRLVNPLGRLSRGVAGTIGTTLVINTPGSEKGCIECKEAVIDVIPHAVGLLSDNTDPHPV